jgi:hypothetical protein
MSRLWRIHPWDTHRVFRPLFRPLNPKMPFSGEHFPANVGIRRALSISPGF